MERIVIGIVWTERNRACLSGLRSVIAPNYTCCNGQPKVKRRAAAGIIRGPDFSPVRVNDGAADGKTKSHALLFRGEERLEDALHFFFRNAPTIVNDRDVHSAAVL